jgi:hypothetical protein
MITRGHTFLFFRRVLGHLYTMAVLKCALQNAARQLHHIAQSALKSPKIRLAVPLFGYKSRPVKRCFCRRGVSVGAIPDQSFPPESPYPMLVSGRRNRILW